MKVIRNTDRELVHKVRSGDKLAFDSVYTAHWKRLFQVAAKIVESKTIAQDIIQDTFISFWEKGCHQEIDNIEAYLYQTVRFRCFMHLRSGKISQKHIERFTTLVSANVTEEEIDYHELELLLEESMRSLPDKCREVFYLSRFEALPHKEIAQQLHISPKTVENQISKAIKHLRLSIDKLAVVALFIPFNYPF